jgi:hypothetical protein
MAENIFRQEAKDRNNLYKKKKKDKERNQYKNNYPKAI